MTGKCETGGEINCKKGGREGGGENKLDESRTGKTGKREIPLMVPKSWTHSGKGTRARIHEM